VRAEYHALKERLAGDSASGGAYTAGKSEFVLAHSVRAGGAECPLWVRFDPFAQPSANGRCLRILFANGSRRELFRCRRFRVPAFSACSFGT
jgi:hypothetical protein